jgi:hypothetical protein
MRGICEKPRPGAAPPNFSRRRTVAPEHPSGRNYCHLAVFLFLYDAAPQLPLIPAYTEGITWDVNATETVKTTESRGASAHRRPGLASGQSMSPMNAKKRQLSTEAHSGKNNYRLAGPEPDANRQLQFPPGRPARAPARMNLFFQHVSGTGLYHREGAAYVFILSS